MHRPSLWVSDGCSDCQLLPHRCFDCDYRRSSHKLGYTQLPFIYNHYSGHNRLGQAYQEHESRFKDQQSAASV
jgi:hypothetical protein